MFNCEIIYQTAITIENNKQLVINITLPNSSFEQSKNFTLNKYPLFCKQKFSFGFLSKHFPLVFQVKISLCFLSKVIPLIFFKYLGC